MDWDDLRFLLCLARHRTLSAAARELRVTQPTVGRRITALERRLGAKLFVRHPNGFTITKSGTHALAHAERMEQEALGAERRVSGRDEGMSGTVRVTASEWMVTGVLAPLMGSLLTPHPKLRIELHADQRHVNLGRREADIALRPRRFEHDAIVERATAKMAFGLYATNAYLETHPAISSGDGRGHVLIAMTEDVGDVARAWLHATLPEATQAVRTNGRNGMLALAMAGVGLACLARIVGDQISSLRRVNTSEPSPTVTLWMGVHRDMHSTPRVRAVSSYLTEQLVLLRPKLAPND